MPIVIHEDRLEPQSVFTPTPKLSAPTLDLRGRCQMSLESVGLGSDIHSPLGTHSHGGECVSSQAIPP